MPKIEGRRTGKMEMNKIYNCDCLDGLPKVPDKSVDLIVIDPPYFLGMTHNGQKGNFDDLIICKPFYFKLAEEFKRILRDDGEFYIFTDWRGYAFYYPIFNAHLPIKNLIVWDKLSGPGSYYANFHELIIYGCMKPKTKKKGGNVWREKGFCSGAKATNGEKIHPTQKPVELIEKIITNSCPESGIVLDCFMGSGTTAVACINTGRQYIGFESNEKYYRIAETRAADALRNVQEGSHDGDKNIELRP